MDYNFYISINNDENGCGEHRVELDVWENHLDLITQFLFEKHYGIPYRELGWWLEDGAWEFVKDIENKWLHNQLSLYPYEKEYRDWVYNKFLPDALNQLDREDLLDYFYEENEPEDEEEEEDTPNEYEPYDDRLFAEIEVSLDGEAVDWL